MSIGKKMLLAVLILFCPIITFAQSGRTSVIYIKSSEIKLLTEQVDFGNGPQKINSLFVWKSDMVIRILFVNYESRTVQAKSHFKKTPVETLFVPIRNYELYQKGVKKGNLLDHISKKGTADEKIEKNSYSQNYARLLKVNINSWNKMNNNSTDRFSEIHPSMVSDGSTEALVRNSNRKKKYENNLPIAFMLPDKGDTVYVVKPYFLDIYKRAENRKLNEYGITHYRHYVSTSLLETSFRTYATEAHVYKEDYEWLVEKEIMDHTLLNVFGRVPKASKPLKDFFCDYTLASYKEPRIIDPHYQGLDYKIDTIKWLKGYQPKTKNEGSGILPKSALNIPLEGCSSCQNEKISRQEKIDKGCPIEIPLQGGSALLASLDFLDNGIICAVQNQQLSKKSFSDWQAMSFGNGFWVNSFQNSCSSRVDFNKFMFLINNGFINIRRQYSKLPL